MRKSPGELNGGLSAATESAYATSLAAGIATIHNAAVLERDYGISLQNLFTLYQSGDNTPEGYVAGHYGIFADQLTADTNPRPTALAAKLLNQADGQILASSVSDGWTVNSRSTQAIATTTQAADALVTYDGNKLVVTLFNDTVPDNEATNFNFTLPTSIGGRDHRQLGRGILQRARRPQRRFEQRDDEKCLHLQRNVLPIRAKCERYAHGTLHGEPCDSARMRIPAGVTRLVRGE